MHLPTSLVLTLTGGSCALAPSHLSSSYFYFLFAAIFYSESHCIFLSFRHFSLQLFFILLILSLSFPPHALCLLLFRSFFLSFNLNIFSPPPPLFFNLFLSFNKKCFFFYLLYFLCLGHTVSGMESNLQSEEGT